MGKSLWTQQRVPHPMTGFDGRALNLIRDAALECAHWVCACLCMVAERARILIEVEGGRVGQPNGRFAWFVPSTQADPSAKTTLKPAQISGLSQL